MTIAFVYWLILLLWLLFGLWRNWPQAQNGQSAWPGVGGSLIEFILFVLIGLALFGSPIKG